MISYLLICLIVIRKNYHNPINNLNIVDVEDFMSIKHHSYVNNVNISFIIDV